MVVKLRHFWPFGQMSAQGADSHEGEYNLSVMAPCFKMLADQGNADAQRNYRVFLEGDEGVSRDLAELVNTR